MAALSKEAKDDYSNTVIYKLRSKNPLIKDFYIGHSKDFIGRKYNHKSDCNNEKSPEYNYPVYKFIRENGGFDNWGFEILVYADLKDKDEAETLEKHYIEIFKPTLNKNDVAETPEEKTEKGREYQKKLREDPEYRKKEAERSKKPEYRKKQAECKKKLREDPEYRKKEAAKRLESYTCICGCSTSKNNEKKHLDSKKHKKFVENNPE